MTKAKKTKLIAATRFALKSAKVKLRENTRELKHHEQALAKLTKRKMKAGGGRSKGNGFENVVAKIIVDAFACRGISRKHCYRTPSSGGHRFAKHKDPSDLVIEKKLAKMFPFAVECKFYKHINLFALFNPVEKMKKAHHFPVWLKQAVTAAKGTGRIPLLVFKQNTSEVLCMFPLSSIGMMHNFHWLGLRRDFSHGIVFWKSEGWIILPLLTLLTKLVGVKDDNVKKDV